MTTTKNETVAISKEDMNKIVCTLGYEAYARLYRRMLAIGLKRRPSFEDFLSQCPAYQDYKSFTVEAWRDGYEYIADLFADRELKNEACDEEQMFLSNVIELVALFS